MTKLHFISLGCPKNLVDSEVMLGSLVRSGFVLTDDPVKAEVIVVNTCAFIEDAKKEAIDTILEMGTYKEKGECALLVVAGCLPQRYKDDLLSLMPEVDVFVGAGEIDKIVEIVCQHKKNKTETKKGQLYMQRPVYIYDHETPRMMITPPHTAYVKIAEGCFHPCSFCIIPKIRGKFRSRPIDSIVAEAKELIGRGVKELNIIAQDTTSYGRDIGESLPKLLEKLVGIEGEKWIRLLYAYPHEFPDGVISIMRDAKYVCKYIDLPIQHINDRILKLMKRKGEGKQIRSLLYKLKTEIPNISMRTSLIVGFPSETHEEFDELLDFVCEMQFDHLGVFTFSPEEGTAAAKLKKRVHPTIASDRRDQIMQIQQEISLGKNSTKVGKHFRALVDGPSKESEFLTEARLEGQAPDIDGVVYINEGHIEAGQFAEVEITDAHEYDLVGRIL